MGASSFEICSFRFLSPLASGTPTFCDTQCFNLLYTILFLSATHIWLVGLIVSDDIHLNSSFATGCVYLWERKLFLLSP